MSIKPVCWLNVSKLPRPNVRTTPRPAQDVWDLLVVASLGGLILVCGWLAFH